MRKICKSLVVVSMALTLSACAGTQVSSSVTRFHQPEITEGTKAFYIKPTSYQKDSIEFLAYSEKVATELENLGYEKASSSKKASIIVSFDYGIDNGREVINSAPIIGQTGGGVVNHSGTVNSYGGYGSSYGTYSGTSYSPATFGVVGSRTYSETLYTRVLKLDIQKNAKGTKKIFEGTVKSTGTSNSFAKVSGCLIKALFKGFPGDNAASVDVTIPMSECSPEQDAL